MYGCINNQLSLARVNIIAGERRVKASALAGKENILKAYDKAVKEKYRFFSFGDCMLIT